jgi:type IV pilus assembly protein PilM
MKALEVPFEEAEALKREHGFVAFGGVYAGAGDETADRVSKVIRNVVTRLHAEVSRSINFYRSQQGGQQPSLLLLTGGSSVIPYTDTFLKEKLRVETDYFNPFNNVAVAEQIPAEQVGAHACEMGQLVGLALRQLHTCPIEVNLLPPKAEEEKKFQRKQPLFAMAAGTFLLAMIVWISFYMRMTGGLGAIRDRIESRVRELTTIERQMAQSEEAVDAVENQIAKLTALEANRGVWRALLGEISGALTEGMWLTRIRPVTTLPGAAPAAPAAASRGRGAPPPPPAAAPANRIVGIEIEGMGYLDKIKSSDVIGQYRDQLRESSLFSDGTEIVWQPPARPDASTLEFKILAVLEAPREL